jgi:CRISPR-associated protein Csb2
MIAFAFSFPAGRYHATPWGRHANEADVAWPPEPARILRALIATWWRKADHEQFPKAILDDLIDLFSADIPIFYLPEAIHTHVRAFMPIGAIDSNTGLEKRSLIYDAFLRLDRDAELVVAWPNVILTDEQENFAAHLLEQIGYLGRAESWADGRIVQNWDGVVNAYPRIAGSIPQKDTVPVDILLPIGMSEWQDLRTRFMPVAVDATKGKTRGKAKANDVILGKTLPERLCDALAVDTSEWQRAGWSSPPPLRKIVYDRPAVGPLPQTRRRLNPRTIVAQPDRPEVARFVLAGRPCPRIEDSLKIGEITRWALMSNGDGVVPPELVGRDDAGPLRDPEHSHAFYLAEDADCDGLIDHLIVYCRRGFSDESRRRLDRLSRLWIEHGRANEEGERGRKEWRVALEDITAPAAFLDASLLIRKAQIWRSVTPYLKARFDKRRPKDFHALVATYRDQILGEWNRRFPELPVPQVEPLTDPANPTRFMVPVGPGRSQRSPLAFARIRGGRGGLQPDTSGGFFELRFETPIGGPISLGWGAHFGLGLFRAES